MVPGQSGSGWRACVLALLIGLAPGFSTAASTEKKVEAKTSELKQLRGRIGDVKGEIKDSKARHRKLLDELRDSEKLIGQAARRLRVLNGSLSRQRQKITGLGDSRSKQQQALAVHQQALASQMRAAYAMGRQERLKILLNQQDPAVVSRVLVYYDYFNRTRTRQMERIGVLLETLRQTETELMEEEQRLLELQSRERATKQQLDDSQEERREVIVSLKSAMKSKGAELSGLKLDEQQLKSLLGRLQDELLPVPMENLERKPFKSRKGRLRWPTKGRLVARFGTSKAGNLKWDGVIISSPEGREVKAIHHGRVAFSDWLRGFGLLLILDHGDGYMSLYGHNQTLFKETGEWVEPGEPLALVGSSGGRSSTGVYFGIRYKGRPVNPKKWCKKSKRNRVGYLNPVSEGLSDRYLATENIMEIENFI